MADYQKMYMALFNSLTDAIIILQRAQQTAEELFISNEDTEATVFDEQEPDIKSGC